MMATFDTVGQASETVAAIIAAKIVPATLEFLDTFTIRTVEDYSHAGLPTDAARCSLSGWIPAWWWRKLTGGSPCRQHGATGSTPPSTAGGTGSERLTQRLPPWPNSSPPVCWRHRPPQPDSNQVQALEEISRHYDLPIGTFGHAGDGNLHPTILTDRRNREEWARVEAAVDAIFEKALELGGTLSGEHGIGTAKAQFLEKEFGKGTIIYSKRIKAAVDPHNILNPGKIIGE
jgi:glycolate oxidase